MNLSVQHQQREQRASRQRHVLLVEDDTEIRSALTQVLEFENYRVSAAENGKLGLEALSHDFDLILLDRQMPVMDGEQFLKHWKTSEYKHIPVLMISAANDEDLSGISVRVLRKPFDIVDLVGAIESTLHERDSYSSSVLQQ